jgi:type VI secretion system ImpA family protein
MSQPAVLELDEFLSPISPDDPVGEYLRWEDAYAELEESRRADENAGEDDVWKRQRKTADWNAVLRLGTELLCEKTKDLQIAAWVAEALAHQHGLAGVRDGLKLVGALQEAFWDEIHPARGDLEFREGVYDFLDHERLIPLLVKSAPVTYIPGAPELSYSYLKYEESRKADNLSRRKFDDEDQRELHLEGRLRGEQFDEAFRATDRQFYVDLLALSEESQAIVEQINAFIKSRWPAKQPAPQLTRIFNALADVKKLVGQLLAKKPAAEPPPEPVETEDSWSDDSETSEEPEVEEITESQSDWDSEPVETVAPEPRTPVRRRPARGELQSADDAREQIADAAHFLRRNDVGDPTSYLVLRALAMGGAFANAGELDPSQLAAPSSAVREKLVQFARAEDEENRTSCLEEAERAMGRAEGRGWFDLHWYAFSALTALGYENPARACKALLKAWLQEYPSWPDSEMRDGTPTASSGARAWLQTEELLPKPEKAPAVEFARFQEASAPAPAAADEGRPSSDAQAQRDPWDEAQSQLQAGNLSEALSIMSKAARQAGSGRQRFIRALQQAELCIALNRNALALPILEGLAQRVDELRLDQWEDTSLCARVFSNLYQCLRGRDDARASMIYDRLCQLDIGLALQMEGN